MRWLLILAVCACGRVNFDPLGSGSSADAVTPEQLASGLLLYFDFESPDPTSAVVGGSATCSACPIEVPGRVGTFGRQFLAGGTCMHVADKPELRPPVFTFALWVNSSGNQLATTFGRPYMGATGLLNSWEMYMSLQGVWLVGANTMYTGSAVSANTWHHVAGAFDGTRMLRYIDGVYTTTVVPGPVLYANDDLLIGCDIATGVETDFFDGALDEVRLYDRMLSASEIAALAAM